MKKKLVVFHLKYNASSEKKSKRYFDKRANASDTLANKS